MKSRKICENLRKSRVISNSPLIDEIFSNFGIFFLTSSISGELEITVDFLKFSHIFLDTSISGELEITVVFLKFSHIFLDFN
jgi:hypothetical protein